MRQIKFRAWHIEQEKMFCVESLHLEDEYCVLNDGDIYSDAFCVKTGDIELMQFTGIQDKNGREVYEGDIVYVAGFSSKAKAIITHEHGSEFEDLNGCHRSMINAASENDIGEVIGNIHQNPELLKD